MSATAPDPGSRSSSSSRHAASRRGVEEGTVWIEAPDAVSAALLMRESIGRLPARLVQCAGRHWRIDVMTGMRRQPAMSEVVRLVRSWLTVADLRAAAVHEGSRTFTVHRGPTRPRTTGRATTRARHDHLPPPAAAA